MQELSPDDPQQEESMTSSAARTVEGYLESLPAERRA
jgi:hypothetical protein